MDISSKKHALLEPFSIRTSVTVITQTTFQDVMMAVVAVMLAVVVAVMILQAAAEAAVAAQAEAEAAVAAQAEAEAATAALYLLFQNLMVSHLLTMTTAPETSLYL